MTKAELRQRKVHVLSRKTSIKPKIEVAKETKHYNKTKSIEIIKESTLGSVEMEIIEEPASLEEDVLFDVSRSMDHTKKRLTC